MLNMTGKIKFYKADNGYGFILPDNGEKDIFFHHTGVIDKDFLKKDDRVEYEIKEGKKGAEATKVRKAV